MKRLAVSVLAICALAGCGSSAQSFTPSRVQHIPNHAACARYDHGGKVSAEAQFGCEQQRAAKMSEVP